MAVNSKSAKYELHNKEQDEKSELQMQLPIRRHANWTFWLVYSTAVCVLGSSLQFGFNTSCINAPEEVSQAFVYFVYLSSLSVYFDQNTYFKTPCSSYAVSLHLKYS